MEGRERKEYTERRLEKVLYYQIVFHILSCFLLIAEPLVVRTHWEFYHMRRKLKTCVTAALCLLCGSPVTPRIAVDALMMLTVPACALLTVSAIRAIPQCEDSH